MSSLISSRTSSTSTFLKAHLFWRHYCFIIEHSEIIEKLSTFFKSATDEFAFWTLYCFKEEDVKYEIAITRAQILQACAFAHKSFSVETPIDPCIVDSTKKHFVAADIKITSCARTYTCWKRILQC